MKVYYSNKMLAKEQGSLSPSAAKPGYVAQDWVDHGLDVTFVDPKPVTKKDLYAVHEPKYVNDVLDLIIPNGFGTYDADVAKSLLYTSGAMYNAAKAAINDRSIAAALCSGFHHAGYHHGGGFCTFNGLMLTAVKLRQEGKAKRVGILDLDNHYGNGTDNIIKHLGLDWVEHYTAGAGFYSPKQAEEFLIMLPDLLSDFRKCDVVLFQAGADPYVKDPLGGWLTKEQLRERDRIVFDVLNSMGVPVAWNLAGGYTRDANGGISEVLEIHRNTAIEALEILQERRGAA
jgi:acetoin utilization deacetylase AcuC-like enzyme